MRWFRLIPVVVLVAACGGSAAYDANDSRNTAGAAGTSDAAGSSGAAHAGAAVGGTAGNGTVGVAGAAGASAGAPSAAGAAGEGGAADAGAAGQASSGCEGLACLANAELVYWPDREWQRASSNPSNELLEADYKPKMGAAWYVRFSGDAQQVQLMASGGGDLVQGKRDPQHTDRAWFDVPLAVGGRFVVQGNPPQFQAELTAYGSGVPIVSSTRGVLKAP